MIFKPKQLSQEGLDPDTLAADKKACRRYGPCGVGEKALYLNSFYIDRCFYVTLSSVRRIFKRVAMSKGGFTGKGMFASIPYLVVEYDDGQRKQCNFKREEDVDRLLERMAQICPDVPRLSEEAERRLAEKAAREAARYLKELTPRPRRRGTTWKRPRPDWRRTPPVPTASPALPGPSATATGPTPPTSGWR